MIGDKPEIIDAEGHLWKWNGWRVYMVEAEEEMIRMGENPLENGYPARSWKEALALLNEYGYLSKGE